MDNVVDIEKKEFSRERTIEEQFVILEESLKNINKLLQKLLHQNVIKENRVEFYDNLSKKAKSQQMAASKLLKKCRESSSLNQDSSIKLLDEQIAELEQMIRYM